MVTDRAFASGSVYLFTGNDSYSKEKAIDELVSSILGATAAKEFDCRIFYGAESDASQIRDYLATLPFLAPKRVAIVKDFDKLPKESRALLSDYTKKSPKSTCLILETKEDARPDDYGIAAGASVRRFEGPTDAELTSWIKRYIASRSKDIEDEAVSALKELQGRNLLSIASELEKLLLYIGNRPCATADDVEEVVAKSLISSAFDLTDAIEARDIERALEIVSESMLAGRKHYEIIGLLCWHLKKMYRAKTLLERGVSEYQAASLLKIAPRYRNKFFRQAKACGSDRIKSRMSVLLEADAGIKRSKYGPWLVLDFTVIRLCLGA
jgi:DNA polymerase III subunit delta